MVVVGLLDLESFHVKLDTSISKSILTSSEENSLLFTIFFHKDSHERAVVKCLHCFLSDMIFPQRKIRRHGEKETKLNKPQEGDL